MHTITIKVCSLAVSLVLLLGCGGNKKAEQGIIVVDLSTADNWEMFNVNELVDSLEVIPLETTEESLVPGYYKLWRGEKYILVLGNENVLQFTSGGQFVRKLADRGRAPEEYTDRAGFAVDEKTGKLCICDWRGKMKQYDLETGEFLGGRDWPHGVMWRGFFSQDRHLVYIPYANRRDTCRYDLCQTTWEGEWLSGITSDPGKGEDPTGDFYLNEVGGEVHFMGSENDTLYVVRDAVKVPLLFIDIPNRYTYEKDGGNMLMMEMESPRWCVFKTFHQKVQRVKGGRTVRRSGNKIYAFDKMEGKLVEFQGIYTNKWCGKISLMDLHQTGEYLSAGLSAIDLRQMVWHESDGSDTVKFRQYRRLLDQMKEDDNPVILSGKIRRD